MAQALPIDRPSNQPQEPKPPFLRSLTLKNFLSFGPDSKPIELRSLNVLIGPNGSGKSNLIEAICFMSASALYFADVISDGGGITEWIWKGAPRAFPQIECTVSGMSGDQSLHHSVVIGADGQAFALVEELITRSNMNEETVEYLYSYVRGVSPPSFGPKSTGMEIPLDEFDLNSSALAQLRDPKRLPEMTYLANRYGRVRAYREWQFGRNTPLRVPQRADTRNDRLNSDFSNLAMFLGRIRQSPPAKRRLIEYLQDLYDGLDDFEVFPEGGTVQIFFMEGEFAIPATRLSDGTLRYLCLLAILCDPNPPPLICIEEPELGLHPDIIHKIADLLVEASQRTQLIVTTHSDMLVDALTEHPESIMVCEKHNGQTQIERLDASDLAVWLDKYSLGELWTSGELGGKRW